jgi:hypothetical protein
VTVNPLSGLYLSLIVAMVEMLVSDDLRDPLGVVRGLEDTLRLRQCMFEQISLVVALPSCIRGPNDMDDVRYACAYSEWKSNRG